MFLSVIIPIYNVEKYLKECIESVLSQSFADYEMILVNDGSTDGSGAICDEYGSNYDFIHVIHQENGGLSDARNSGTKIAQGMYIMYIDSDDYLLDASCLQKIYESAQNAPDVILYKYKKFIDGSNKFIEPNIKLPDYNCESVDDLGNYLMGLVQNDAFYCAAWMKTIKRTIIQENDIQFEKGLLSEDQEWYYHVLQKVNKINSIDEAFIAYRQRANSITSSVGEKNLKDTIYIISKWSKDIKENVTNEKVKEALLNSLGKLYANLIIAFSRVEKTQRRAYKKDIKDLNWLLEYDANPRTQKMKKMYQIIGFDMTVLALEAVTMIRNKKNG